jgi:hypothetical protein
MHVQARGDTKMNMKPTYFSRSILLVVLFSSLLAGCCFDLPPPPLPSCNLAYAKQAKELSNDTVKLVLAISAIINNTALSEGLNDEQVLQYVYSAKPELEKPFSNRKVRFTRINEQEENEEEDIEIEVTVYADDQTTVLVTDDSSTDEIDYMYQCK